MTEISFLALYHHFAPNLPEPQAEYRFDSTRRWRFDYAWPNAKVAVEVDGGQWKAGGGRHNTDADREKLNNAAALGWRVLRFSYPQLLDRPDHSIDLVRKALHTWLEEVLE